MVILVTNDDGIYSAGINTLAEELKALGRVVIVAPDRERSASSHSLTMHRPVRAKRLDEDRYAIDGTPTDCVNLAVNYLVKPKPDIIVSGINHGGNMGEDVTYSGTVSAALEATLHGYPAIALSAEESDDDTFPFKAAARAASVLVRWVLERGLPEGTLLNVNVPGGATPDRLVFEYTNQGKRIYSDILEEKLDPRGRNYYWLGGEHVKSHEIAGTDCYAVDVLGRISITPIQLDMTNYRFLQSIRDWGQP